MTLPPTLHGYGTLDRIDYRWKLKEHAVARGGVVHVGGDYGRQPTPDPNWLLLHGQMPQRLSFPLG